MRYMLVIIYTNNKCAGVKVKNKLINTYLKKNPELKNELQVGVHEENIERIEILTNSSSSNDYFDTVKSFIEGLKDQDIKKWYSNVTIVRGEYTEQEEPYDFFLWLRAKGHYKAAMELKEKSEFNDSYIMLLSFSLELFLKCIGTRVRWVGCHGYAVNHEETHKLDEIYSNIKLRNPYYISSLEEEYNSLFNRSFYDDLEINSLVFVNARYPYLKGGIIPKRPNPLLFTAQELLYGTQRRCDSDVDIDALECASYFLYDKTCRYFNYK